MARALNIVGEYPPDWPAISDATWAAAGHRCIRGGHPYRKGEHGKGEWTPCDERCSHGHPISLECVGSISVSEALAKMMAMQCDIPGLIKAGHKVCAQWRIGTVHHMDGDKDNCVWWNLLALCQRCHLTIQSRVNPQQPYMLEHSDWFKPYVAGFYAFKYEGRQLTREQAIEEMPRLLAIERIA